jgi:hypothetical protein
MVPAVVAWLALAATAGGAAAQESRATVEVFVREGCSHCAAAETFLSDLARRRPELEVRISDVSADRDALRRLERLARDRGVAPVAVPAIDIRGRLFVGFDAATGRAVEAWLDRRDVEAGAAGPVCPPAADVPFGQPSGHAQEDHPLVRKVRPDNHRLPL